MLPTQSVYADDAFFLPSFLRYFPIENGHTKSIHRQFDHFVARTSSTCLMRFKHSLIHTKKRTVDVQDYFSGPSDIRIT